MKTVRLHGDLGLRFGERHEFEVGSAAEAVRALSANFEGFREYMLGSDARGVGYHVLVDQTIVEEVELEHPVHEQIQIIPALRGAGSGDTKILLGSALIVAGVVVAAASGGGLSGVGLALVKVGAALTITGIVQTMTPVPSAPTPTEKPGSDPSYTFNGPVNTT
ncbi:MAG: tail assembly protein, partial [Lysobacteraceae bacterium]